MHKGDYNRKPCFKHSLCGNFRHCPRCAAIRQARVANATEKLAEVCGPLSWSILYPHGGGSNEANQAKLQFLKKIKPEGAIWTIEQSKKNHHYHVNIITPQIERPAMRNAEVWTQGVAGNVRHVGAYIAKRGQMPDREDYAGNLFGTAGNLWQVLSQAQDVPIVQAACAQYAINPSAMTEQSVLTYQEWLDSLASAGQESEKPQKAVFFAGEKPKEFDKEQAREVAARWLPDILEKQRAKSAK